MTLELGYDDDIEIPLNEDDGATAERIPTLRLQETGQCYVITLAFHNSHEPVMQYPGFTVQARKPDGSLAFQDKLYGFVMPGTNCMMALPRASADAPAALVPAVPGTLVRTYIKGHNRFDNARPDSFMAVTRSLKDSGAGFNVGNLLWAQLEVQPLDENGVQRAFPKKVVHFSIRATTPDEVQWKRMAVAKYHELKVIHEANKRREAQAPQAAPEPAPLPYSPIPAYSGPVPAQAPIPSWPAPAPAATSAPIAPPAGFPTAAPVAPPGGPPAGFPTAAPVAPPAGFPTAAPVAPPAGFPTAPTPPPAAAEPKW